MNYRKEIDGLRAIAVVPVILFHGGFAAFSGGFVGVDVFFVISGYLITSIIIAEKDAHRFSLLSFYERRARRILPALFAVMLFCLPFAWLWMPPAQLKAFAHSLVAVSIFASNILFWRETGYFTPAADEKPLLHTWSLAVEEQFYMLFPLFMILLWNLGRRWLIVSIALVAVVSLLLAQMGGNVGSVNRITDTWNWWAQPTWAFYLLPSRAWELMIGALVAICLYSNRHSAVRHSVREAASLVGLALITFAVFSFDSNTPFPGVYALIPTIGTALIIVFAASDTLVGRFLAYKGVVGIGLISYSAYLWHQPLFAFARLRSLNEPSAWLIGTLAAAAFVLAHFSWRFIERPFRDRKRTHRRLVFKAAVVATVLTILMGLSISLFELHRPIDAQYMQAIKPPNGGDFVREKCLFEPVDSIDDYLMFCKIAPGKRIAILYGDSHAEAAFMALRNRLATSEIELVLLRNRHPKCETMLGSFNTRLKPAPTLRTQCLEFGRRISDFANSVAAENLFILFRYTFRLYPTTNRVTTLDYDNGEGGKGEESYREYYVLGLNGERRFDVAEKTVRTVEGIDALISGFKGKTVIIGPVPEVGWNVMNRNYKSIVSTGRVETVISTSHDRFKQRNSLANEILAATATRKNVILIKPEDVFCDTFVKKRCVAQMKDVPFYTDDDHLSNRGAELLADHVFKQALDGL